MKCGQRHDCICGEECDRICLCCKAPIDECDCDPDNDDEPDYLPGYDGDTL